MELSWQAQLCECLIGSRGCWCCVIRHKGLISETILIKIFNRIAWSEDAKDDKHNIVVVVQPAIIIIIIILLSVDNAVSCSDVNFFKMSNFLICTLIQLACAEEMELLPELRLLPLPLCEQICAKLGK